MSASDVVVATDQLPTRDVLALRIQTELSSLRKGKGLPEADLANFPIMSLYGDNDWRKISSLIRLNGGEDRKFVQWALNITRRNEDIGQSDLTQRRESLAQLHGMSFRTAVRREDEAIRKASLQIADFLLTKAQRSEDLRKSLTGLFDDSPNYDLRTALRRQDKAIKALRSALDEINTSLDEIVETNIRIAQIMGL